MEHLESNVCLGEGRVQESFTILAPYIEKVCGIIVFRKFSCGTYVIVALNSDIVVFLNMRNFFVIGSAIFSMVVSNFSIFLRGVTVFGKSLAALQSFFCPCVYFCHKTGFDSVILRPVAVFERCTLLVPNNIPMIISYAVEPINRNN